MNKCGFINAIYQINKQDILLYADAATVKKTDNAAQSTALSYPAGVNATITCSKTADAGTPDNSNAIAGAADAVSSFWNSVWHQ